MAKFDSGYPEKISVVNDDTVLLADSQDLSGGKKKVKKVKISTIAGFIGSSDVSLKADRVDSGSQQIPLFKTGDGFVKGEIIDAIPAEVTGSISITENNLTEPTLLTCAFLYVQAKGYVWGLQLDKPQEIPSGYIGEIAPNATFTRIASIAEYEEVPGYVDIDESIYGDYEVIQNANPIAIEVELTINDFNEGSDAGIGNISPLLTLDSDGLLNFNFQRVQGVAMGTSPTDAVNFAQLLEIMDVYYLLYGQTTILSTPENPPFNLTSVIIDNKPGKITAEVGDAVQFTLPNSAEVFNGTIKEIDGKDLVCDWIGYTELPVDDAGNWGIMDLTVDSIDYPGETVAIATEYTPKFDGNGINQIGALGNHLAVDRIAQMSFVLNSINRIGTKVVSKIIDPSEPMNSIVVLNRALTNTEGLSPDVWYCYNIDTGERLTMSSITGSGDTYILTHDSNAADKVGITFLGENLPFVLP